MPTDEMLKGLKQEQGTQTISRIKCKKTR